MAATLKDILLAPDCRPAVVSDLQTLVDQEVASKTGMSGIAIKGSFAVVKRVRSGFIPHAIDQMLPEFAHKLQPYYERYDPAKYRRGHWAPTSAPTRLRSRTCCSASPTGVQPSPATSR